MSLESSLEKIRSFVLDRYKNNLASILVFGSANTGHFKEGKSDIDTMIFLKEWKALKSEKETKLLLEKLRKYSFRTQYFHTLESIKEYIQNRTSFSTYIVIASQDGSRILYSTPEFEKTRKFLIENPPTKESIKEYVREKDKFELDGYFKNETDFKRARSFFAHFRRKLQIMNYFETKELIFDYDACLANISLPKKEKVKLNKLYEIYEKREAINDNENRKYGELARKLTKRILKS